MIKKLFKIILLIIVGLALVISYFLYARQKKNIQSVVPYPYYFEKSQIKQQNSKAPILIIGDRMGKKLSLFKDQLAKKISTKLSKPIEINTITEDGLSMARVLNKVKNYGSLPFIIIFAGGSQEHLEKKFNIKDLKKVELNFKRYDNLYLQTVLTVWPQLSKYLYTPLSYVALKDKITKDETKYTLPQTLKRNIFTYKLFERETKEFFTYTKDKNSYLIALTTPINLEVKPRSVCSFQLDQLSQKNYNQMIEYVKLKDFKQAYSISKNLSLIANNNALIHYMHGQISKSLAKFKEARKSLEYAASLDCENFRATPIYNSIIKKIGQQTGTVVFDFNELVYSSWGENVLFESDLYPQNLYYEKLTDILAIKIKKVLKL